MILVILFLISLWFADRFVLLLVCRAVLERADP